METIYDWVSLAIFAGIIVLFLHRATSEKEDDVSLFYYLVPAVGCAVGDYLGNHGQGLFGGLLLAAAVAFILFFLKPLKLPGR